MENFNHSAEVERAQVAIELARTFLVDDPMTALHRLRSVQRQLRMNVQRAGRTDAEFLQLEAYASELVEEARVASERWQRENERRELEMRRRERAYIIA